MRASGLPALRRLVMTKPQKKQERSDRNKIDKVGKSGVYPVSEIDKADPKAKIHGEASFGQGERGAAGYEDSGSSEIFYLDEELEEIKKDDQQS
jgi:hypothetical protein